jgi:hypothetical protein
MKGPPMTRRAPWTALVLATLLVLATAPAAFAATDDTIPGDALPATPVNGSLDETTDARDFYHVDLDAGETLQLSLTSGAVLSDFDLYLYGPSTAPGTPAHASAVAASALPSYYPETISYTAPTTGTYYIELYAAEGSGTTTLAWSIVPEPLVSIYRFYNIRTGTHFYTPSLDEANSVVANYSSVFRYEGIAYYTRASKNSQPLYRFYNKKNGSHFYTASAEERDQVIALYPSVFTYEGETYKVTPTAEPGKTPVYRFYNLRNGSHFFTASLDEANTVIAQWSNVYRFEGPAFYLGL